MSDGTVQSIVVLVTKKGEQYEINSFLTREEFRDRAIDTFKDKGVFVFPIQEKGAIEDVIIPHDVIHSLRVREYSAIRKIEVRK